MVTAMAIFLLAHIEVSHGAVSAQARLKPAVDAPDRREPPTEVGGKRRSAEADPYLSFQWWAVPTLHGFGWWAVPTVHGFRWWAVPTVHGFGWWSVPTLHGFGWWAVPTLPYVCSGGSARSQSADPAQTLRTTTRTTPRTTTRPTTRPVDPGPRVAQEDLALLVTYARRAFRAAVMALPERSARFYPPELAGMKGIIHLTLRSHGVVLAEAESAEMDVVDASVAAGTLLGREALRRKAADGFGARLDRGGDDLGIELEWLGDREYLTMGYYGEGGTWTDALLHAFEPAVEGIGVELRGKRGWTRPSEVVTLNYSPDLALTAAERGAGLRHLHKMRFPREIRYFRFWAYHLWQPADRVPPVRLVRGSTLVSPLTMNDAASARGRIDAAIDRMGSYLQYRQNPGGGFSHEFVPGADRYGTGNSARVQLQALEGLATYAAWRGKPDVIEGARRGIDAFRKYLVPMTRRIVNEAGESVEQSAGRILVLPGHGNHLDITARLLGAMLILSPVQSRTAEGTKEEAQTRDELIAALLSAQTDEGRFAIVLDSEAENRVRSATPASLDLGSGPALLTLARVGSGPREALSQSKPAGPGTRTLAERIDRSIMRALTFYRRANRPTPAPTAASFLARGFAIHYANTNDARLSDFVFEITDRLIRLQLHEGVCRYPELFGAINVREPGLVGADTAIYLTTLAEALVLARRVGDTDRIRRYQAATLSAVRFLLQLEVREIDCYAIRSPRDALKGVRTSPWNARIRVDHCANTVVALIRARAALFGERERPTAGGSR